MIAEYEARVLAGEALTRADALQLWGAELEPLCQAADEIRRHFQGGGFDLCTIVNGKSGRCPEDCKYCAQSARYGAGAEEYPLLPPQELAERAAENHRRGVLRFSVVTSGRALSEAETAAACDGYRAIAGRCQISLCGSHGLLSYEQLSRLRAAGVTRYHCNLETSRRYFPAVCTTHTYDDKIAVLREARRAGLELCSGGIIGMGETPEDRIDLALELRRLGVRSVPVNILAPIPGTPFGNFPRLTEDEVCRTVAVFRFLLPNAAIRMAGGRGPLTDKGARVFRSGANAAITGDMLTTAGITIETDLQLVKQMGFEVKKL